MLLPWIYGLAWFLYLNSPLTSESYKEENYACYYDDRYNGTALAIQLSLYNCYVNFGLMPLWYILTLVVMRIQHQPLRATHYRGLQRRAAERERSLTIQVETKVQALRRHYAQACLICSMYWLTTFYWYFGPEILSRLWPPIKPYTYAIGNELWLLTSGVNPLVYLTLNRCVL